MVGFRWSAAVALCLALTGCGGQALFSESASDGSEERVFGFIPRVDAADKTITFDEAQWLTGDAADRAAVSAGAIEPGEQVPNDYFIRNPDPGVVVLPVAADAQIRGAAPVTVLLPRPPCDSCTSYALGLDAFFAAYVGTNRTANARYWVTIREGRVVAIEEQYVP
jgi:hypothetical protein